MTCTRLLASAVCAVAFLVVQADAESLSKEDIDRLSRSVVQVIAQFPDGSSHYATGFVYKKSTTVVTALHVVAGSDKIRVYSHDSGSDFRAAMVKALPSADLAMLQLDDDPGLPSMEISSAVPAFDHELFVLGHALGARSVVPSNLRIDGTRQLSDITPLAARDEIRDIGFPSLTSTIIHLMGPLVPGHSGAPIIDENGKVAAIGDGGLERGASSISWAIPASRLAALAVSRESTDIRVHTGDLVNLYAADLKADVGGGTVHVGDFVLRKDRTRTLEDLRRSATSEDTRGLGQLIAAGLPFDPDQLKFDIFVEHASGATLVVPAGLQLHPHGQFLTGTLDGGQIEWVTLLLREGSAPVKQRRSVEFEQMLGATHADVFWRPDPQWSYLAPYVYGDNVVVNRKSWIGQFFGPGNQLIRNKYCFETLAGKNDILLGAAAVNNQLTFPSSRNWVATVLGVHLTTFSNLTGDGNARKEKDEGEDQDQ